MYLEKIKHKDQRNRGTSFLLHFSARRDDDIAVAAESGDLAAVRGHLRRDRRCLDRLFEAPGTGGHWAALHAGSSSTTTRRSSPFSWRRARPWTSGTAAARELRAAGEPPQRVPPTPAVLRSDSAACCSTLRLRGERQAAAGSEGLGGRQERQRLGASADVTTVFKTVFHRQPQ